MVIVIALVIGILCSSLIVCAYFYRTQYQRAERYARLQNNVSSGVNILLGGEGPAPGTEKTVSLFGREDDSVLLKKTTWGIYDIGVSQAFIQRDTLYKVFSIANTIDSGKWAALYLIDEDRPLSVSGKTAIRGDAYISKAGIKEAYVDNQSYQGDKKLIQGKQRNSDKKLPDLSADRLAWFEKVITATHPPDPLILTKDSTGNSFLFPTRMAGLGKKVVTLENIKLTGNIMLFSDTTLIISATAVLNNIIVFARSVIVKSGFRGNCQLFATDSIHVEPGCRLSYPSALGVLRFKPQKIGVPEKISIGERTAFAGLIFTYDKNPDKTIRPLIDLGKEVSLTGQVYAQGILGLKNGVTINGSVFTSRFLYQSSFTRYENYIINTTIDATALSPYYLTSDLVPVSGKRQKILQWLEAN
jgi:hypothetical protein